MTRAATGNRRWSVPADVVRKLRRRWDSGEFLTSFASGEDWVALDVPLRGPTGAELAGSFSAVQDWVRHWRLDDRPDRRALRVETRRVGGRVIGANEVPCRAWVDSYDQLWSLLGVTREVGRFTDLLAASTARAPRLRQWMIAHPMQVLTFRREWDRLVDTVLWIGRHQHRGMYLRQVDVPGVDTKFIEGHRKILAALLDQQLAEHEVDASRPVSDFAGRYRFRKKPDYVRFRWLDPDLDPAGQFTELSVRADELAGRALDVSTVFVVENEVTYLAFPPVERALVVFGGGYSLSRLTPLTWLTDRELVYWGDIDTHGFAILNQLRRRFGQARSMLMDRSTLLAHEGQWVREPSPTNAHLDMLHPDEAALYTDLVEDLLGPAVRLEQERVSYSAIRHALPAGGG